MRKWNGLILMLLAAVLVLSACGKDSGSGSTASGSTGESSTEAGASNDADRTIDTVMGQVKVPAHPKKIVVLTNEGTEALLSMGIKPVGAVKSWTGDPWYPHIKDQMQDVENVGDEGQPNVEAIAALEPDLILGTKMRQEKIYEQLSAIAPTVFSETLRGEWKENFKLWADAVDEKEKGDQVLADYDKHVADVKAQIGDKLSTKVSMVRFMPGKARIYYNDTFSGIILKEIGLARPAVQDNPGFSDDVGKERIPDMNGDILFYFTYETGDGEGSKMEKEWTEDKLWKNLDVVKKGNAHRVDDAIWNTAGGVIAANLMLDQLVSYFK
ncbi:iron complex transport system substrate-binding protein [Paenibacillus rhizosphaerae]|uniref:Iron complex transport system substrate-binding protein n=1 Tax=Paenibacillus rhizosphaerae TaxID=297318 RepID=A0A839TS21_9BACL|nr:iron-siderophore ABC transporter substrate-binding protein [Paenibacillus rhizosphaerae]MBB3127527.1 iron complex transport system substrate-binding protein [Paenibacillus rhizosphaerae]